MTKNTVVTAAVVREAFRTGALDLTSVKDAKGKDVSPVSILGADGTGEKVRGKVHPAFIAAYLEANPGTTYGPTAKGASAKSSATITLPVFKTNAKGAKRKHPVTVPMAEFRRLSETTHGRPSSAAILKARDAYMSENGLS